MAPPRPELVHVVGTRPNFVKAAPVLRALSSHGIAQSTIHTGQHHDPELSDAIFRDLGLLTPDIALMVPQYAGDRAVWPLGSLVAELQRVLQGLAPTMVVVYGDVQSTLAGALAASDLGLPIAHVEAGLRSFDLSMPEEFNRRVTDLLAELLFTTSPEAIANLAAEGIDTSRAHHVGNSMIDTLLANLHRVDPAAVRARFGLPTTYALATIHRPGNVDEPADANRTVRALAEAAGHVPIVMPLHPRGRVTLAAAGLMSVARIVVLPPLGYIDFLSLMRGAVVAITDSGGVQEETTYLGVPCLTLRPNTERPITVTAGTNRLVSTDELGDAVGRVLEDAGSEPGAASEAPPLWDGRAGERIAAHIVYWLRNRRPGLP